MNQRRSNCKRMTTEVTNSFHRSEISDLTRMEKCSQYNFEEISSIQGNMSALYNNLNRISQKMVNGPMKQLYQTEASINQLSSFNDTLASAQLSPNNYTFTPSNALVTRARHSCSKHAAALHDNSSKSLTPTRFCSSSGRSLTPTRLCSTPTPVPARVDLGEMSAIDTSARCKSAAMEWSVDASTDATNQLRGPFSSTMMYPSRSTPRHMSKRSSGTPTSAAALVGSHGNKDKNSGSQNNQHQLSSTAEDSSQCFVARTACKLEFDHSSIGQEKDSNDSNNSTLLMDDDDTMAMDNGTVTTKGSSIQLKRLISDKVMSIFNFHDSSDDSMDTHVDSLHTPSSSTSSLVMSNVNNADYYPHHPPPPPSYGPSNSHNSSTSSTDRPACVGEERHSLVQQGRDTTDSAYSSTSSYSRCSNSNSNSHHHTAISKRSKKSSSASSSSGGGAAVCCTVVSITRNNDTTVNSDTSSFMEKPLCKKGVAWSHLEKSKKRSILSKLKEIGRHLHQGKPVSCSDQMETLAVL